MTAKVKVNSKAAQAYLDGEHGVREMLRKRAERVLAHAKADPHDKTHNFENGLRIREDHTDRVVFRVGSTAPHSHLVEAQFGVMAKALDAAGGA